MAFIQELPRRLQQLSSCSARVFGKHAARRMRVLRRPGAAQVQVDPSLVLPHPGAHPRTCSVAGLPPGGHGIRLRVLPDCPRGGSSPPSLHRDARDRSYSHLTREPLSQLSDLPTYST